MTGHLPLRDHPGASWWDREVIRVAGVEAVSFLQGQLSQDVAALPPGGSGWSFLLEPQGKLEALLRVVRVGPDEVVLHVDAGFGASVVERLERFKIRVKAEVELLDWRVLAVRGPEGSLGGISAPEDLIADAGHPGLEGWDLLGPAPVPPPGVEVVDAAHLRAALIEAGIPTMGVDLEVGAIPAESGLVDRAASFTKGCYTGQELVARIDSRGGRAPHQLVGVRLDGSTDGPLPALGTALLVEGTEVGLLTSVIGAPARPSPIGLARVKRSVELPVTAEVGAAGGRVAQLQALPLVS